MKFFSSDERFYMFESGINSITTMCSVVDICKQVSWKSKVSLIEGIGLHNKEINVVNNLNLWSTK